MTNVKNIAALFSAADRVFEKYLESKKFVYASMLYKINKNIYAAILSLPLEKNDLEKIILHYSLWFSEFEYHKFKKEPHLEDTFVFETLDKEFKFPKEIINKMLLNL